MNKKCIIIFVFSLLLHHIQAQNINSPYSVYGIGTRNDQYHDKSMGFANASNALTSASNHLYLKNPASIATLVRSNLYGNLSFEGSTVTYSGAVVQEMQKSSKDFGIKNVNLAVKINNIWATGLGFQPYTTVSYAFTAQKQVEGSLSTYTSQYNGDGGIYDVYWQNAFALGKHFAIGVKSSFLFGSLNFTETLEQENANIAITSSDYFNNFKFEYGAIYKGRLSGNWGISLGAKFNTQTTLRTEQSLSVNINDNNLMDNNIRSRGHYKIPKAGGVGIALEHKGINTYSIDYDYEEWNSLNIRGNGWSYRNQEKISAGFQRLIKGISWGQIYEKGFFQTGAYFNNGYLRINNQRIREYGVTFGYGQALSPGIYGLISIDAGSRGTTQNSLIKENFVRLKLNLSLREYLYSKGRLYN